MKSFIFAQAAVVSPGAGATCEFVWCVGCVHGCLWVLLYVCASKSRLKYVCVCAIQIEEGVRFRFRVRKRLPRFLYFQTFLAFFETWWVLFEHCYSWAVWGKHHALSRGLPVDVYRQVQGITHTNTNATHTHTHHTHPQTHTHHTPTHHTHTPHTTHTHTTHTHHTTHHTHTHTHTHHTN